jgi:hypothetical protein
MSPTLYLQYVFSYCPFIRHRLYIFLHQISVCLLVFLMCASCSSHIILLDLINLLIFGDEWKIKNLLTAESSRIPCYFFHRRPKCLPQYPILEYPQPTFIKNR